MEQARRTSPLVTAEQLLRLPDDGLAHELVNGRLISVSPPGFAHGICGIRLMTALAAFVERRKLGVVVPQDTGFVLRTDPDTVRAPDIAFVARERLGPELPAAYWQGAPDLAVEVLSPGERERDVEAKVREYLACGAKAVWVVRPRTRTMVLHHPDAVAVTLTEQDTLTDPLVLPGFRFRLTGLFERIPRK